MDLTRSEIELAGSLPRAPNGPSLHELADGLLDTRGPAALRQVKTALGRIAAALGEDDAEGLILRPRDDDFGHADAPPYGHPGAGRQDGGRPEIFLFFS